VWRRRRIERLDKYKRTKYMMPTLMDMGVDITPPSVRSSGGKQQQPSLASGSRRSASRKSSLRAPSEPPRNWTELAQHLQRTRTPSMGGSDGSRGRSHASSSRRSRSHSRDDDGSWDSVRSYGTRRSRSQLPRVDEQSRSRSRSFDRSGRSASPPLPELPHMPGEGMALAADRLLNTLHDALGVNAVTPFDAQRRPRYPPGAPAPPGWGGSGRSRDGGSGSGSRSRSRGNSSRSARTGSERR
jgi:hypothetical protein